MSALDLCTRERVQILTIWGERWIEADRLGDFAAHAPLNADLFTAERLISHLPTGRRVVRGIRSAERAAEAMQAIMRLRNDWAVVTDDDLTPELRAKVEAAVKPFGGRVGVRDDHKPRLPHLNGYSPESFQ